MTEHNRLIVCKNCVPSGDVLYQVNIAPSVTTAEKEDKSHCYKSWNVLLTSCMHNYWKLVGNVWTREEAWIGHIGRQMVRPTVMTETWPLNLM